MEGDSTGEEVTLDEGLEKFDGGDGLSPLSSQFSSCGESEFDRYCSANSVMGTPSVCSSMGMGCVNDSFESDFGSLKSLEGFSLGSGSVPRRFEDSTRLIVGDGDRGFGISSDVSCGVRAEGKGLNLVGDFDRSIRVVDMGSCSSVQDLPMIGSKAELKGIKVSNSEVGKKEDLAVLLKNVENVLLQGVVAARSAAENLLECNHADEMEDDRCQEDDETSSKYEHSEGEDSMFNYGSDDGCQPNPYYVKNVHGKCDEDAGSKNVVLMDSSVAFGCKDWEDFELDETEENIGMQLPVNFWEQQRSSGENEPDSSDFNLVKSTSGGDPQEDEQVNSEGKDILGSHDFLAGDKSIEHLQIRSAANFHSLKLIEAMPVEDTSGTSGTCSQIDCNDGSDDYLENCSMYDIFGKQCSPVPMDINPMPFEKTRENQDLKSNESSGLTDCPVLEQHLDRPPNVGVVESSLPIDFRENLSCNDGVDSSVGCAVNSISLTLMSDKVRNHDDFNLSEDKSTTCKGKDLEMDSFYDEVVHEMEEILLDSSDSSAMRLRQIHSMFHAEQSSPIRDGGSAASTSGLDHGYSSIHDALKLDGIKVVGAKQRKGDVSLSERLVGVKEYTVYVIRVWSGKDQWEVERRYRDFYTLYRRLKSYFTAQEWTLPPPWSSVERESRKFFGNGSPHVIAERSTLIQECLSSILQPKHFSSPPSALVWFLSPSAADSSSSESNAAVHHSNVGADTERVSTLGKTVSLIVDLQLPKSVKELLDKQHYTCAGCHRHFDNGKTRVLEIAQSFGWGKPRFCEYTGQLFCSSCHNNETVVLPARVLHNWDFTPYPVSQLAKSYLDSIIDKPMLCVSAANPLLFSKVPALLNVVGVRRRIGSMLPYIRCSFRRSVYRRLGYRKYLLESNEFFALRDLIDLSKGAFAALPSILEAVLKKIQEHITELCLECCDNGVPCGARQACDNPSSLIFPFQEEVEIQRCKSCSSVFHKHCFRKLVECPCGEIWKQVETNKSLKTGNAVAIARSPSLLSKKTDLKSPVEFISSLFSLSRSETMKVNKEGGNVILMGSLPSTSL